MGALAAVKLLLDTHILVWLDSDAHHIRPVQRRAITDSANEIFISAATAWEIGVKVAKGTMKMKLPLQTLMEKFSFIELPISIQHGEEAASLPPYHRDPFDRLLIAQARLEGMALVTSDAEILRYPVTCI